MLTHLKYCAALLLASTLFFLSACSDLDSSTESSSSGSSVTSSSKEMRLLSVKRDDFTRTTLVEYNEKELDKLIGLFDDLNIVVFANEKFDAEGFAAVREALKNINAESAKEDTFLQALATLEKASGAIEKDWNEYREKIKIKIDEAKKRGNEFYVQNHKNIINDVNDKEHQIFRGRRIGSEMDLVSSTGNKLFMDAAMLFRTMAGTSKSLELRTPFTIQNDTKAFVLFGDYDKENYLCFNLPLFPNKLELDGIPEFLLNIAATKNGLQKEDLVNGKYIDIFIDEFDRNGSENWIRNFKAGLRKSTQ